MFRLVTSLVDFIFKAYWKNSDAVVAVVKDASVSAEVTHMYIYALNRQVDALIGYSDIIFQSTFSIQTTRLRRL